MANIISDNLILKFTELLAFQLKPPVSDAQKCKKCQCPSWGTAKHVLCRLWRASVGHDVAVPIFNAHI